METRQLITRFAVAIGLLMSLAACSGSSPTAPPPPPTGPVIAITGNLGFGTVQVGQTASQVFTIRNVGGAPLVVTSLTLTGGLSAVTRYSWIAGTIAPGGQQEVVVSFTPTAATVYQGILTVVGNQQSGVGTIEITGGGTLTGVQVFFRSGTGDSVFDLPVHVRRVIITATYNGNSSNFIVRIAGSLVVNELVGTFWQQPVFVGTYQVTPGVVQITQSSGVAWTIQEFR